MADPMKKNNILLTYEDYITLPNDRNRYEILEGELIVTPSPTFKHQEVSRNLLLILHYHIKKNNLGKIVAAPMDVILEDTTVAQPDIIFISKEKYRFVTKRGIECAPDLLVEILSPSSKRYDRVSKMQIYGKHSVTWYWIVDPDSSTVEEYRIEKGNYVLAGTYQKSDTFAPELFPDLKIELSQVWA